MTGTRDPASFRDPSGFVLRDRDGTVLRQVNPVYEPHYQQLMQSGLYDSLTNDGLLIRHEDLGPAAHSCGARLLRPHQLSFVSYPYEWSFSQLQDAALLTLEIQRRALDFGMSLKDASAYNVQLDAGRPVLIDTLSFEPYEAGAPWVAYAQLCRHFLAPLALMSYTDIRLQRLLETHIDGVPLDLAARLLPARTRLKPGLVVHLFLHAWMQRRYAGTADGDRDRPAVRGRVSETGMRGMIDGLQRLLGRIDWRPQGSEWADYYQSCSYSDGALALKQRIVASYLDRVAPGTVWDLGANTGVFSRMAAERGAVTVACDLDPACVEHCYREMRSAARAGWQLHPLRIDLASPSPALGWACRERQSLLQRGPADLVMMLALIHHLAISNNVPFSQLLELASSLGRWLIIEFVPKEDRQVQRLLRSREDIFTSYTRQDLEAAMQPCFEIVDSQPIELDDGDRRLYLLRSRSSSPASSAASPRLPASERS